MILGQSSATAACLAITAKQAVQDVEYEKLKKRLLEDAQVLEYGDKRASVVPTRTLQGIVVDDAELSNKELWVKSSSKSPFVEYGYRHDGNAKKGELSAVFTSQIPKSGKYGVRMSYTSDPNRATNVPVVIRHANGETISSVDQRKPPKIGGLFHSLGTYNFEAGQTATVGISNKNTDGFVIIDAVQWVPLP